MDLRKELEDRLSAAMRVAGAPQGAPALVARAARPEFGDYQANGVMAAAKQLKTNPRALAERVVAVADLSDLAEPLEAAGPGFINIRLKTDWLARQLAAVAGDERLGAPAASPPQTVVVDYSAPNLAKEMHVGHLRSTIIGDALARVLEFLGHKVIRQNHVGDWGTQFGMLTAFLGLVRRKEELAHPDAAAVDVAHIEDLEAYYQEAKRFFDENPEFAEKSRDYVVRLQRGDPGVLETWRHYKSLSWRHCADVYQRLGVTLTSKHTRGESAYNDDLPHVIEALRAKGLLTESQGAQCVFLPEFTGKDGQPLPLIVQKSDEGYLYATTDLAAVRYRVGELGADRILYVVDARQSLHFRQMFAVARKAGFAPPSVSLEHVAFGVMTAKDGRPFKTREGGTVKLMDLLDEAEQRALDLVNQKNPDLSDEERKKVAHAVGIGAVKYADLAQNRMSDYVFSWDKMLSLEGNTAPYMQYAYARVRSIFRKGEVGSAVWTTPATPDRTVRTADPTGFPGGAIRVVEPAERALAVGLMQFAETVQAVAAEALPNLLCAYLFDLAGAFMGFYESCPVLKAPEPVRGSRLALCDLTARVIDKGLDLLGIETIPQM